MSQGLNLETIEKWESKHSHKFPESLRSIYQTLNGGRWPGTDFEFCPLELVLGIETVYPDEDLSELFEVDNSDPEMDEIDLEILTPEDLPFLYRLGQSQGSQDIFINFRSEPQSLCLCTEFDLSPFHPSAELFFSDLVNFDDAPLVNWGECETMECLASETLKSLDGVIENHLGRDEKGCLILLSRISAGENEVLMTRATVRELNPLECSILAFPTGYFLHLEPLEGKGSEIRSASSVQGWKNEKEDAVTAGFMSQDQDKLRALRSELIGNQANARLLQQEEAQDALVAEFSGMGVEEQEAASAALASSVLRDAMQNLEYDDEDDPDGIAGSILGGFKDSMEQMVLGLESKASAGGVTSETTQKLADLVKGLVEDENEN